MTNSKGKQNYAEMEKFMLEQMEGESDDDHLSRVKTIKEFWEIMHRSEDIAA